MGRLFLIEFDQAPGKTIYLCRSCRTHIALKDDFICTIFSNPLGIFLAAVNLVVDDDPAHQSRNANKVVAQVFCIRCNMHLGFKFIYVKRPDAIVNVQGRIFIFMKELLFWNERQQLVAAI